MKKMIEVPPTPIGEHSTGELDHIPVAKIRPNPENPRIKFRPGELEELQESIRRYGVQVPISVYRTKTGFVLIDGERRWRCVSKLNHKTIPALIQEEPKPLENLLLMFNIHALREQWDLLTIALKLPKITELLERELKSRPTESDLSAYTGLPRGVIRKCRLLADLPEKYKQTLLDELDKPKSQQAVGEEFFVEMEKALGTVVRNMPKAIKDIDRARDALLIKYRKKVIDSNIEFRKMAKIARANSVGADPEAAETAIRRLVSEPAYSIGQAFAETVSEVYAERDLSTRLDGLISRLASLEPEEIDEEVRAKLAELVRVASAILEDEQ